MLKSFIGVVVLTKTGNTGKGNKSGLIRPAKIVKDNIMYMIHLAQLTESLYKQLSSLNLALIEQHLIEAYIKESFSGFEVSYEDIKISNGKLHRLISSSMQIKRTVLLDMVAKAIGYGNHHAMKNIMQRQEKIIDLRGKGFEWKNNVSFDEFYKNHFCLLWHYTSSTLLRSIKKEGLLPVSLSGVKSSNLDAMSPQNQKDYVHFVANEDRIYAENAVKVHGGTEIVLTVKVPLIYLEADDYGEIYSKNYINPKNQSVLYEKLTNNLFRTGRTQYPIAPHYIVNIESV